MALIQCKECGAKFSDHDAACPNCGFRVKQFAEHVQTTYRGNNVHSAKRRLKIEESKKESAAFKEVCTNNNARFLYFYLKAWLLVKSIILCMFILLSLIGWFRSFSEQDNYSQSNYYQNNIYQNNASKNNADFGAVLYTLSTMGLYLYLTVIVRKRALQRARNAYKLLSAYLWIQAACCLLLTFALFLAAPFAIFFACVFAISIAMICYCIKHKKLFDI